MWNGTHTKAYILNSYEFVLCLTVFAFPGLYIGFHVLWVLWYDYLVARPWFYSDFLFYDYHAISILTCSILSASWVFPLDICIIVLTLLHHLVLLLHSPGEYHLTPLDSHVQVLELGACVQSSAAVAWIPSRSSRAPSFQAPCESLEFFF